MMRRWWSIKGFHLEVQFPFQLLRSGHGDAVLSDINSESLVGQKVNGSYSFCVPAVASAREIGARDERGLFELYLLREGDVDDQPTYRSWILLPVIAFSIKILDLLLDFVGLLSSHEEGKQNQTQEQSGHFYLIILKAKPLINNSCPSLIMGLWHQLAKLHYMPDYCPKTLNSPFCNARPLEFTSIPAGGRIRGILGWPQVEPVLQGTWWFGDVMAVEIEKHRSRKWCATYHSWCLRGWWAQERETVGGKTCRSAD